MASHKVPQNVEAEDKLLGPLSLKQLIFAMVGIGFGYLTYFFFANVHPISSVIWLPFTAFFLVLGLYQRKDQPVEVFLAAAVKYYFGERTKIWNQEAYQERVIITAPPKIEHIYTKNFSGEEAVRRLDGLSAMMDSRGWSAKMRDDWQNPQLEATVNSTRLITAPATNSTNYQGVAAQPTDIQDQNTSLVARQIDEQLSQSTNSGRQHAVRTMQQARSQPADSSEQVPTYQQYPTAMRQKVVQPTVEKVTVQPDLQIPTIAQNTANSPIEQTLSAPSSVAPPQPQQVIAPQTVQQDAPVQQLSHNSIDDEQMVEISLHDH